MRTGLALGLRRPSRRALRAVACAGLAGLALGPAAGAEAVTLSPGDSVVVDARAFGNDGAVIRVDPVSGAQATVSSGGSFATPFGVAVEADRDILVADRDAFGGQGGVIRIDPVSGAQTTVSSGGSFASPTALAVEADGDILVADQNAFAGQAGVIRVDPVSGAQTTVSSGGSFVRPFGVAVEADGDIVVADTSEFGADGWLIRVDPVSGAQTTLSSGGSFVDPFGVAVEADGNIVVADANAFAGILGGVIRVDPVSGAQTTVSSGGSFLEPIAVAVEADGNILILDPLGGVIRVDPVSGAQTTLSSGGSFVGPSGVAVVPPRANELPVANGDAYTTPEDTPLRVAAPGVLGNDSDAGGDALAATQVSGPAHGTLTLNADGAFTYTPAADFSGRDSFSYRASDGTADSDATTVTITVSPAAPAPPAAVMRLQAPDISVFGRSGSQARCHMRTGRLRSCSVRLRLGRRVLAHGSVASTQAGRRGLTVTLTLTRRGQALLARRLGGVRARMHARGATTGGTRTAVVRTRALLRVERFRTPAGSWMPNEAELTARGRSFVRSLRGKLIAVARLRCDGHDANVRASSHTTSRLSRARAALMCGALGRLGVRSKPTLAGHGDSRPIASNAVKSGRAQNRRVEVTITHRLRRP